MSKWNLARWNMMWGIVWLWRKLLDIVTPSIMLRNIRRMCGASKSGLTNISLSLSGRCSADCIFCPIDLKVDKANMPVCIIEKILGEIQTVRFRMQHNIEVISIGENGDVFLHPNAIDIMRMVRRSIPYAKIVAYTNFRLFTPEKIDTILSEKLIDFLGCNIDGATAASYQSVKRAEFEIVFNNMRYFLQRRTQLWRNVPLMVSALTYHDYVKAIYQKFGRFPRKVAEGNIEELRDDFDEIVRMVEPLFSHPKDKILRTVPVAWAEREMSQVQNYENCCCPQLSRIKKEAFIAPDGAWYACCFDGLTELRLGNVKESTIQEIYDSDVRRQLIDKLTNKAFRSIGGPCATVDCCQRLDVF